MAPVPVGNRRLPLQSSTLTEPHPNMRIGGIILCGGRSSRMGRPKAMLPVGNEVMLQRVCRTFATVVAPLCVVAAADQELPDLSDKWLRSVCPQELALPGGVGQRPVIQVARDSVEYRGPLAGLAEGIRSLAGQVDAVYLSACDAPLLRPAFIKEVIAALGEHDIAVPWDGRFHHPLAGVYRVSVLPHIEELLLADRLRPVFLFEKCSTRLIDVQQLREVDPDLESLCNTNTPDEYAEALRRIAIEESQ